MPVKTLAIGGTLRLGVHVCAVPSRSLADAPSSREYRRIVPTGFRRMRIETEWLRVRATPVSG